jgi:hypothetical protein
MSRKPDVAGFPPCEHTAVHDGTPYECDLAARHDGDCLDQRKGAFWDSRGVTYRSAS